MRSRNRVAIIAVAAAVLAAAGAAALEIGDAAPMGDVKMQNVDGEYLTLAGTKGSNGLLVVFTCNHCPWAQAWESRIVDLGNAYRSKGIGVIAVNPNDPTEYPDDAFEPMKARAKEKGYAFPYVVDSTSGVAKAFGATKTPEVYLFDATGRLVYTGAVDDNARDQSAVKAQYLKDALEAVANGGAIPVAKTKALGCSIKFR